MPTFSDRPCPFNWLQKGFASTFECYQSLSWLQMVDLDTLLDIGLGVNGTLVSETTGYG